MPATTWQARVHVFNYFTCLLDRGGSEFYDFYSHFIGEEVINDTTLDDKSRYLSITAVLLGTKSHDLFKDMLDDLLKYLTADEIQEVLYQAVAYLGIGMVLPILKYYE